MLDNFKENWDDHLPLIVFAYNNTYHSSIQMSLYEPFVGKGANLLLGGSKLVKQD